MVATQPRSKHVVCAIAEGFVVGGLAPAQIERTRAIGGELHGLDGRALVRAIAERLLG